MRWKTAAAAVTVVLLPASLAAAEGGSGFIVSFLTTIWAIVSFLIVLFVIWKFLLPPILKGLDRRAESIRESLDAAEKAREEAQEMMARHQADLEKARHEARAIIDEGKADAERLKDKIVSQARQESEEIAARARREIELAKQSALDDLHKRSVDLSIDLAARLIKKKLDAKDHQDLIQERIQSLRDRN